LQRLQAAAAALIEGHDQQYYAKMRVMMQSKRNLLYDGLQAAGLTPIRPEGGIFMLADAGVLKKETSVEAAISLIETKKIGSIPGSAFYANPQDGDTQLRFTFAKPDEVLNLALMYLKN